MAYCYLSAGSGSLGPLWSQDSTSTLVVDTNTNSGYIYVYNDAYSYQTAQNYMSFFEVPFSGSQVTLTLYPMTYAILVYNSNGVMVGEAMLVYLKVRTL
ncbi:hypothetical protein [Metallosphaera hakonensis]|uniref:hypothetical protein n=1 Tax=Metallosphaera hakonensis TaxID=79601 RepID=UPI0006D208B9|nr:hypothetical protein [Metallosphaera hakonensis]